MLDKMQNGSLEDDITYDDDLTYDGLPFMGGSGVTGDGGGGDDYTYASQGSGGGGGGGGGGDGGGGGGGGVGDGSGEGGGEAVGSWRASLDQYDLPIPTINSESTGLINRALGRRIETPDDPHYYTGKWSHERVVWGNKPESPPKSTRAPTSSSIGALRLPAPSPIQMPSTILSKVKMTVVVVVVRC